MEISEVVSKLEVSKEFKDWRKLNEQYFLAHAFVMLDEVNKDVWQIGFYNSENNLMTTFFIEPGKLKIIVDQEVLKSDIKISPLLYAEVSISVLAAINIALQLLRTEYLSPGVVKTFFIIQQLREVPVYNITFFTRAFKTINVKINAMDGKILHHSISSVADFS